MLSQTDQERLIGDICRASYEAMTLEELGSQILPLFDRLVDTSTSLLYRRDENGQLIAVAGSLTEGHYIYAQHYYSIDPMQRALRRLNPLILHAPSVPEWKEWYMNHSSHVDCSTHYGFDNFIHLRLSAEGIQERGMVSMVLARTSQQPDFSERERMILAGLLPTLETLTRRSARLEEQIRYHPFLESILDFSPRPKIALDPHGGLIWASERAEVLLAITRGGRKTIPDPLVKAARDLGSLTRKKTTSSAPSASVTLPRKDANPIRAELRLVRNRNGNYFVIAELEDTEVPLLLKEIAAQYRLTAAETQILHLISLGLSNREIGHRLFVSVETVHSHVAHVLGKLGVRSRIQAALVAHGHPPEIKEDEE